MGVLSTEYLSAAAFFRDSFSCFQLIPFSASFPVGFIASSFVPLRVGTLVFARQKSFCPPPVEFAEEMRKVRRSHTKSRKGCVQCKNGHVKVGYIA